MASRLVLVSALAAAVIAGACGEPGSGADVDAADLDAAPEDAVSFVDGPLSDGSADGPVTDAGIDGAPACPSPPNPPGTSAVIGAAGGTVALGTVVRVVIPAGALATDTTITLRPLPLELAWTYRSLTAAYELGPSTLAFSAPATLTVDLGALPPAPDEIALMVGPAAGPFAAAATTRTGTAYSASIAGATLGFGARTAAPPAVTAACAPTAVPTDTTYLFQNPSPGGPYHTSYARPTSQGFAVIATHQVAGLWNVHSYGYTSNGTSIGSVNLTGNTTASIFGGHVAPSGTEVLVAYDSNQSMGSEVWVARKNATGGTVGTPVRVSQDPGIYSQIPQIVALPGGGAFVVWRARDTVLSRYWLRAAVLDSSLVVQTRFDVTPMVASTVPTGFALVGSASGVGLVWSWVANTSSTSGARYQAFTHAGCPMTEIIDVADGYVVNETVSATLVGDQVLIATSGNTVVGQPRVPRLRAVHLTTGLLGASRRFDDVSLTHLGVTAHGGGVQITGANGSIYHQWLGPELDRRSALTEVATSSAISDPSSIATSPTGDAALVTWVDEIGGGTARGRVRAIGCTP